MSELFKNVTKARDAVIERAKQVPSQLIHLGEQVQTFVKSIDLTDVKTLPSQIKTQAEKLDLNVKLTVPQAFTDRLGQAKVFAPIDVEAIQTRISEVGEYVQTIPSKLQAAPAAVKEFVTEFPDSATKLANETTAKAKTLVEDLKSRPILFVPRKADAKKPAKKATAKKSTKAGAATNGTAHVQPTL